MVVALERKKRTWTRSQRGCKTCRQRHVKCDETFPSCKRCSSTGRICDGFVKSSSEWEIVTVASIPYGVARRPSPPGVQYDSRAESSFAFFQDRTVDYVAGLLDRQWKPFVLKMAEENTAIYHAVLAVGSMHKTIIAKQSLCMDLYEDKYAVKQYALSMRMLASTPGANDTFSVEMFLVACILFISFENLRRNYFVVAQHIQSGLRIMLQRQEGSLHCTKRTATVVQNLVPAFARLERQFQELTGGPTPFIQILAGKQAATGFFEYSKVKPQPIPHFKTLDDAWTSLHQRWHALIRWVGFVQRDWFNHLGDVDLGRLNFQDPTQTDYQQDLRRDFDLWSLGLQNLKQRLPAMSRRQQSICALLECHILLADSVLGTTDSQREMLFDNYVSHFRRIVALCRVVVDNELAEARTSVKTTSAPFIIQQRYAPGSAQYGLDAHCPLTFDLSISMILLHVSTKCRDATVRLDAIKLMEDYPRVEGLWDGIIIAKCARMIDKIERNGESLEEAARRGAKADEIALSHRVLDLRAKGNYSSRSAEMITFQGQRESMLGTVSQSSLFEW